MRYSPIFITGLLVIIPPTIFAQEADVGDKPANAERMSSGGRERNTLLSPTDIDFYEMTIRDNSGHLTVNFSQEAPPGANPNSGWRLDIYAEEDLANSLYTVVLPETSLEVELEQGLGPGTYYYKVSSISDQVFPDAEYTINNSWEDSDNYEIQPNNSPDTATPIRANEAFWGNLSSMQDIDFFSLCAPSAGFGNDYIDPRQSSSGSKNRLGFKLVKSRTRSANAIYRLKCHIANSNGGQCTLLYTSRFFFTASN
jgi:hypothetical protein